MLKVVSSVIQATIQHCKAGRPHEACGYLAGKKGVATCVIPMRNAAASGSSYAMDPAEQIRVAQRLRRQTLEPMVIYHSHVAAEAYPSDLDVRRATEAQNFFRGHYLLVTLQAGAQPQARAFRIQDGCVSEEELVEVTAELSSPRKRRSNRCSPRGRGQGQASRA